MWSLLKPSVKKWCNLLDHKTSLGRPPRSIAVRGFEQTFGILRSQLLLGRGLVQDRLVPGSGWKMQKPYIKTIRHFWIACESFLHGPKGGKSIRKIIFQEESPPPGVEVSLGRGTSPGRERLADLFLGPFWEALEVNKMNWIQKTKMNCKK